MTIIAVRTHGRSLIETELFTRITNRITIDHPQLAPGMPERILDQALAFVGTCATTTQPIGPSELVDIGWHAFLMYTHDYTQFCERIAGYFIHHEPDDTTAHGVGARPTLSDTVTAMRAAGYVTDADLWHGRDHADCSTSKCTQCHAGCTDSPRR